MGEWERGRKAIFDLPLSPSPFTTHHSPLTTHHSPLTTHHSPSYGFFSPRSFFSLANISSYSLMYFSGVAKNSFPATAAANVIGLALVSHLGLRRSIADDAERSDLAAGLHERYAFLVAPTA